MIAQVQVVFDIQRQFIVEAWLHSTGSSGVSLVSGKFFPKIKHFFTHLLQL
jgi:hypothetical protein